LEKLVKARLIRLTEGSKCEEDQIEVAHEALVRNWDRVIEWLETERVRVRNRLRLSSGATEWQRLGREHGALLRGVQLERGPIVLDASQANVTAMTISPDSQWLGVGYSDNAIGLWNLGDLTMGPKIPSGHEGWIAGLTVSKDKRLADQ
jgi:WD40 repeat protein